jgi:choloylglycine hydrolase
MVFDHLPRTLAAAAAVAALAAAPAADACTGIVLVAKDGTAIHARTLEFGTDLKSAILMLPRGHKRTGTTPDGTPGLSSTAKYASVGMNAYGLDVLLDGLNEKGLAVGLFYFPGSAGYMAYEPADAGRTVAPWELGSWMLENFATLDEVRAGLAEVVVPAVVLPQMGMVPDAHYVVRDASGASLVVEIVGGVINIHDAPLGVITNAPTFDWHMTNLRNYISFSPTGRAPMVLNGVSFPATGMGSGMLGMPGDFTPPSRFVRAVAFTQSVLPQETGRDALLEAFHILNNFDIPKGAARAPQPAGAPAEVDYTLWTGAADLKALTYNFRTYQNSQIRSVSLMEMAIDGGTTVSIPIDAPEVIVPLVP